MRVTIQGTDYEYDEQMNVAEARILKEHDIPPAVFPQALMLSDPDAIVSLVFILKKRAGEAVKWSDFDDLVLSDVELHNDEDEPEPDGEEPPDPTKSPRGSKRGKTQKRASTST